MNNTTDIKDKDTYKIFWKITVSASEGKIEAYKDVSLWDIRSSNAISRVISLRKPLQVEVCELERKGITEAEKETRYKGLYEEYYAVAQSVLEEQKVFVEGDNIVFNGGFLRILDDGLKNIQHST